MGKGGMHITVITPADKQSRSGNRVTAVRWARLLSTSGHRVRLAQLYAGWRTDLLIALHARHSAASVFRFRERYPAGKLVVGLAGTDIYQFLATEAETVLSVLASADALVGLHDLVSEAIPEHFHGKLTVIYQSAKPLQRREIWAHRHFDVLVIAHLREVKDPLRAAEAVRILPASSRIRVLHFGRAMDASWEKRAHAEMEANPRYLWRGEVSHGQVRRALARARLLVLSSLAEGGANVISEAVMAGVPILASCIPSSVGLLGRDYPGYFPPRDHTALAELMLRAEQIPTFLAALEQGIQARRALFHPAREREAWESLLARLWGKDNGLQRIALGQDMPDHGSASITQGTKLD
jgi:putative glycosyltransferase (TIGR04348 family)